MMNIMTQFSISIFFLIPRNKNCDPLHCILGKTDWNMLNLHPFNCIFFQASCLYRRKLHRPGGDIQMIQEEDGQLGLCYEPI